MGRTKGATKRRALSNRFLGKGRLRLDAPARWGSHLTVPAQTNTLSEGGNMAEHFPVNCNKCRQTHVLAERRSIRGAL